MNINLIIAFYNIKIKHDKILGRALIQFGFTHTVLSKNSYFKSKNGKFLFKITPLQKRLYSWLGKSDLPCIFDKFGVRDFESENMFKIAAQSSMGVRLI